MKIDWRCAKLDDGVKINPAFRMTQNVRRYFSEKCGPDFTVDRAFRQWLASAIGTSLEAAANRWTAAKMRRWETPPTLGR